jgi:hypothetical protein
MLETIYDLCGLDSTGISKKLGRNTTVSRMALTGVPPGVGSKIIGHKSLEAYKRYNMSANVQAVAAQECLKTGENFNDVLECEMQNFCDKVVIGCQPRGEIRENIHKSEEDRELTEAEVCKHSFAALLFCSSVFLQLEAYRVTHLPHVSLSNFLCAFFAWD